jgi:DNA invertase Pin-like site-specific DNA recombinase
MSVKFIAYYRVSTKEQGKSGLGLDSQKDSIQTYITSIKGELISEFTDIETGKNDNRENLWVAVNEAKNQGATLIVKKFDRLSRGGLEVMSRLEKLKVPFIECDSPHDNTLLKELKFSIARDEVRKTSERTQSALSMINKKIKSGEPHISKSGKMVTKLGNPENLTNEAREKGREKRILNARNEEENKRAYSFVKLMKESAGYSHTKAAKKLNESGFLTPKGGMFSTIQVIRLIKLFE